MTSTKEVRDNLCTKLHSHTELNFNVRHTSLEKQSVSQYHPAGLNDPWE
jgi:hypothetical protein